MAKHKVNYWKTGKKFLIVAVEVVVLGFLAWVSDHIEFLYLVPVLEALRNILKHS